jgi:hypothetical protein
LHSAARASSPGEWLPGSSDHWEAAAAGSTHTPPLTQPLSATRSDESNATTGKRLESVGVENTEDNRRDWRHLLYSAPGVVWLLCGGG